MEELKTLFLNEVVKSLIVGKESVHTTVKFGKYELYVESENKESLMNVIGERHENIINDTLKHIERKPNDDSDILYESYKTYKTMGGWTCAFEDLKTKTYIELTEIPTLL